MAEITEQLAAATKKHKRAVKERDALMREASESGLSAGRIAEATGLSVDRVRKRLQKASEKRGKTSAD
jgi:DNA-directed RNA polymerase specialized sigma24 family protein